jgi:hypothetical protein
LWKGSETLVATETVWCHRQALDLDPDLLATREVGPMADLIYRQTESAGDRGGLGLRSFRRGDTQVIALAGTFDGSTMREVERELVDANGSASQVIVLDLRLLEFIDSQRLRVVVLTGARPSAGDTRG